ncbi:hypothetical protein PMI30_03410 [Pseudomonas sp. GM50]|uniref:glycosyltransferase n=1 Tax=Pseudomonas sp. GM50 TaxID=1144332 RepID=UPI00027090B1|nr:glycosyltransferase [Pseudomonas sp. GM50]EJM65087.1 hypothetical protein PMI30_03410 [Pseudomonas sp. GM50]
MGAESRGRRLQVGWCVVSLSLDMASVRYRAILPLLALEDFGHTNQLFTSQKPVDVETLDALVIVKNFSIESYSLAQKARARGVPVIIDLCDNIFIDGYGKKNKNKASDMFIAMSRHATAIVTTTEPLAEQIRGRVPGVPVCIVPDGVASDSTNQRGSRRIVDALDVKDIKLKTAPSKQVNKLSARINVLRTSSFKGLIKAQIKRRKSWLKWRFWAKKAYKGYDASRTLATKIVKDTLRRAQDISVKKVQTMAVAPQGRMRLLWFGNHGAAYAKFGMLDLLEIREALEMIALEFPVQLVVISNSFNKYEEFIKPMAIPSIYHEWSIERVEEYMSDACVVLIPNSRDAFSICKSANRTVHALTRGIPVVATGTPALLPLAGSIVVDDFVSGLRRYLSSKEAAVTDVALGLKLIDKHFSSPVIGALWQDVLFAAMDIQLAKDSAEHPELIVLLHLIQDLDLALPLMLEAKSRGIPLQVWSSITLLRKSPRVVKTMREHDIFLSPIAEATANDAPVFSDHTKVMLSIAETNLGPHRFTRKLTEHAKKAGIFTATLQHGFENVGLTYSDEIHVIEKINFAADRIYLWGPLDTLHPRVSKETKSKCLPIGLSKPISEKTADLSALITEDKCVIGIFENLHWHRYSDEYRKFFLDGVMALAQKFTTITFLIKPHHAGLWLTSKYEGDKPVAPNVLIADPQSPDWESYTASALLGRMKAVITTPSTVAMDAARLDLSVAVVAHELEIDSYKPLYEIRQSTDWADFVAGVMQESVKAPQNSLSRDYVNRMIVGGNASSRIVDDLFGPKCTAS